MSRKPDRTNQSQPVHVAASWSQEGATTQTTRTAAETFQQLPPSLPPKKCPNTQIFSGEFNGLKVLIVHRP